MADIDFHFCQENGRITKIKYNDVEIPCEGVYNLEFLFHFESFPVLKIERWPYSNRPLPDMVADG